MLARENFTNTAKKSPEQKAQWQQYHQLSEEENKSLSLRKQNKKSVDNTQPESKRTGVVPEPLKSTATKLEASAISTKYE